MKDAKLPKQKTVHLILNHKWYDLIEQDKKRFEYRRNTARLRKMLQGKHYVVFHRGYTKVTITFRISKVDYTENEIQIRLGERVAYNGDPRKQTPKLMKLR